MATIHLTLETRRIVTTGPNQGKHNVKLWLTCNRKQRMYKTPYYLTVDEWTKVRAEKKPKLYELDKIRKDLIRLEADANQLIEDKNITTHEVFELHWLHGINTQTVKGQFEIKIKELEKVDKISSAENYRTAFKSFAEYSHEGLTFQEITKEWLDDYEKWYVEPDEEGHSDSLTSVGFNTRCLRHIFKRAIKAEIISDKIYPFGADGGYVIPEGGTEVKQFLEEGEKDAFVTHRFNNDLDEYHDYAIFSYYAQGINFADIFRLKKNQVNYQQGFIQVTRQKTKGRTKKLKRITIVLHPTMIEIIKRHSDNLDISPNAYLFPKLKGCKDEKERFKAIRRIVRKTNSVLEKIAKKFEWAIVPTTYTIRHTFSATFLRMGGTTEELQDALGHGDIKTTETYKHGFSLEKKRKFSEGL